MNHEQIDALIAQMTLEEKCAQLGGVWHTRLRDEHSLLDMGKAAPLLVEGIGHLGAVAGQSLEPPDAVNAVNTMQRFLAEKTRLGIPAIVHEEALEGLLGPGATQFPQAIGMAATWDPDLVGEVATTSGRQARALGARLILSPVLDIAREPRWGRTEETFGEDPELVSRMGVAFVKGMQSNGVECCAKHFLGHGSPLAGLNHNEVVIGPRRLRDVDAAPFRAVIHEAGLTTVMNAYHEIDGLPVANSPEILDDLLRDELGLGPDGIVVADYYSVDDLLNFHRVAVDSADAARQALHAGLDVELPDYTFYQTLAQQVRDGTIDEAVVDRSVRRVLRQKARVGLFDNPYADPADLESLVTPDDIALARRAAARTMVLLTNDGKLQARLTQPGEKIFAAWNQGFFIPAVTRLKPITTPDRIDIGLTAYYWAGEKEAYAELKRRGVAYVHVNNRYFGLTAVDPVRDTFSLRGNTIIGPRPDHIRTFSRMRQTFLYRLNYEPQTLTYFRVIYDAFDPAREIGVRVFALN